MKLALAAAGMAILLATVAASQPREELIRAESARYRQLFQSSAAGGALADENIDVKYYRLNLTITAAPPYIRGDVSINATSQTSNLMTIHLDLMNSLTIDSVLVGGTKVSFSQQASSVSIRLDHAYSQGETIPSHIFYQGVPGSSGFGSFAFSTHGSMNTPWIWSLSEPYGAKDWWPCKDHPSDKADSADMIVTVDSSYKVGSNGRLVSVSVNDTGTVTYHWHEAHPISSYLISVAITNYAAFSNWFHYTPTDSMEVLNYVLPEHLTSAQAQLPVAVTGLGIFSDLFGLYPFIDEKYGHSEFEWGGAMEHQTMTSTGSFSEDIIIHELAHQWFGDMITCRT